MEIKRIKINRITDAEHDILFEERESVSERASYATEQRLLSAIRRGDRAILSAIFKNMSAEQIAAGNLSVSDMRQAQYMAVALITLATRAAIDEGVPQAEAFSLSDECILRIDREREAQAILQELYSMAEQFLERVSLCKNRYSRLIKAVKDYISSHLHGDVSLECVSRHCEVSPAYLSRRFREETGETLHSYILQEKLKEARVLLSTRNLSCASVSSILGFSSQSHFTACFQKQYGITPVKFRRYGAKTPGCCD